MNCYASCWSQLVFLFVCASCPSPFVPLLSIYVCLFPSLLSLSRPLCLSFSLSLLVSIFPSLSSLLSLCLCSPRLFSLCVCSPVCHTLIFFLPGLIGRNLLLQYTWYRSPWMLSSTTTGQTLSLTGEICTCETRSHRRDEREALYANEALRAKCYLRSVICYVRGVTCESLHAKHYV